LSRDLRIAVIDQNPLRAAIIEEGLRAAGHTSVVRIDDTAELLDRIRAIDPDVILIDLESPSRDVLEQMFKVSRSVARPVAMFVDRSDAATIDAGVSAYIVDGLRKDRVKTILDMTISRFNAFAKLKKELETAISRPAATPVAFDGPAFSSNDIASYLVALKAKRQGDRRVRCTIDAQRGQYFANLAPRYSLAG
jgi:AmiR/NasT family two-component response regulator